MKDKEDSSTVKNAFQIITSEEKSFTVYAETPEEKDAWLKDFTSLANKSKELDVSAPVWIPDAEAKKCMLCQKSFTVVNRRVRL